MSPMHARDGAPIEQSPAQQRTIAALNDTWGVTGYLFNRRTRHVLVLLDDHDEVDIADDGRILAGPVPPGAERHDEYRGAP